MTLSRLIALCDQLKPNQYDQDTKTQWINEIEGTIIEEIINKAQGNDIEIVPYEYDQDAERKMVAPDQFSDVYLNYLYAKIDYHNAEFERYNNSVAVFNSAFDAFSGYYRRNNIPKQPASLGPI